MFKRGFVSVVFILMNFIVLAQPGNRTMKKQPKVVVALVVDNFRTEYIYDFWENFRNDGIRKLVNEGAFCNNVTLPIQNINNTTGSATLFTGTYPKDHGIVSTEWYHQISRSMIHAVKDADYISLGSDSEEGNCSALKLKSLTISDHLKITSNFHSKVFSISLNAETAIMSAGHMADASYWFDSSTGNFISSSYYLRKFPKWVFDYNKQMLAANLLAQEWDLLLPKGSYSNGFKDNYVLEKGFWGKDNTFPYSPDKLGDHSIGFEVLKATPWGNKLVKDFGLKLMEEEEVGNDEYTDFVTFNFSTLDFANKWYEPKSVEVQDLYVRLDKEIASIINYLDKKVGKGQYLVMLTGSCGSSYSVDVQKDDFKFDAGNFSPKSAMALLKSYLNAVYGVGDWIIDYHEEQIFLNHELIQKKDLSLNEMQDQVADFLNQFEGIATCLPGHVVEKGTVSGKGLVKLTNSYCTKRSGDVVIVLEKGWKPTYKYTDVFYTDYNKVPLVWYGSMVRPTINDQLYEMVDIVPSMCRFLNMMIPEHIDGDVIEGIYW